jgi:glucose dehydrogenase
VQVDGFLRAIDANTGKLIETFGDRGGVELAFAFPAEESKE